MAANGCEKGPVDIMKTYHIIDTRNRSMRNELKHYTFDELKAQFEPGEDEKQDLSEEYEKWQNIKDLFDLEEFLEEQAAGMEQPYVFEEDEVEDTGTMKRANSFYAVGK